MVRHTHRRRQSRGRRRNTRRSRRTQRGGNILTDLFSSTPTDADIQKLQEEIIKLQEKLNKELDPIKKAEIQEEISNKQAEKIKYETIIKEKARLANGGAISSTSPNRNSAGQFQSPANVTGTGTSNYLGRGGRRRRSHRRR